MENNDHCLILTSSYPAQTDDMRSVAGLFVRHFARELAKHVQVSVLTQSTDSGPRTFREGEVRIVRFPWPGKGRPLSTLSMPRDMGLMTWAVFGGMLAALRFAGGNKIRFVLAMWAIPSGLWAFPVHMWFGVPYAVWCLGSDIWDYGEKGVFRPVVRFILQRAKTRFADGFKLGKTVERLSGKTCLFLPSTRDLGGQVAVQADLRAGKRNYLFIGRYHPNKGPDVLMESIRLLSPEIRKAVHFHFFGGGPLEHALKDEVERKGIGDVVSLHGYMDEAKAASYLRACDALIIPSRIESIPVVFSDALQCGCPMIVTNVGDMGNLLMKYGAGRVVEPQSPTQLSKAIAQDFSEGSRFYKEGFDRLRSLFDLETTVNAFLDSVAGPSW